MSYLIFNALHFKYAEQIMDTHDGNEESNSRKKGTKSNWKWSKQDVTCKWNIILQYRKWWATGMGKAIFTYCSAVVFNLFFFFLFRLERFSREAIFLRKLHFFSCITHICILWWRANVIKIPPSHLRSWPKIAFKKHCVFRISCWIFLNQFHETVKYLLRWDLLLLFGALRFFVVCVFFFSFFAFRHNLKLFWSERWEGGWMVENRYSLNVNMQVIVVFHDSKSKYWSENNTCCSK